MRFIENKAKEFEQIIDSMSADSVISILHDADPDGICASILLENYLESKGKKASFKSHTLIKEKPFSKKHVQDIIAAKTTHLIILDYSVDGYGRSEEYTAFKESYPDILVLVFDHHPTNKDLRFDYVANTAIDQNQIRPDQYCTSKYVYDILSMLWNDVVQLDWIAAIGIIGDANARTWGKFVQDILKKDNKKQILKNKDEYPIPKEFEDYFASPYGKIAQRIFYGVAKSHNEVGYIYKTLKSSDSVEEILSSFEKYNDIEEEVDDYIDNFLYCQKNTPIEESGLRIFELEIKSQHDIIVITSNMISLHDTHTIFLLYERRGDSYFVSVRYQKADIPMGNIMSSIAEKIPHANGGGHPAAAGGKYPKEHFEKFLQLFYKEVESAQKVN